MPAARRCMSSAKNTFFRILSKNCRNKQNYEAAEEEESIGDFILAAFYRLLYDGIFHNRCNLVNDTNAY